MTEILQIRRGDTYPIAYTLTRNGDWTLVGSTVEMSFEFDDAVVHTFVGTVTDDDYGPDGDKIVEFEPTLAAVASIRCGKFDIQVDDGAFKATHITGTVDIKFDVTP